MTVDGKDIYHILSPSEIANIVGLALNAELLRKRYEEHRGNSMTRIFESKRGAKFNAFGTGEMQILYPEGVEWVHLDTEKVKELIKAMVAYYLK